MLYAMVETGPVQGGEPSKVNGRAARALPGIVDVLSLMYGVAVVGSDIFCVRKARDLLKIEWKPGAEQRSSPLRGGQVGHPCARGAQGVLTDRAASEWLKTALRTALARDPVNALNDAFTLAGLLDAMTSALRACEENHPEHCQLIPSTAQFYGFSKGANLLDEHVEWIYVPAVKDASKEQLEDRSNTFGRLVVRAVRSKIQFTEDLRQIRETAQSSYQDLLSKSESALDELSAALQRRVSEWAHPDARVKLKWEPNPVSITDPAVRILAGEGNFLGELSRFGHGLQRSYLLALLHELAATGQTGSPTLLFACEEPELYQHPPQARHLASVLTTLGKQGAQVMISTHSPLFVTGDAFEDVRLVRKDIQLSRCEVKRATFEQVAERHSKATGNPPKKRAGMAAIIHRVLQPAMSEIFFASRIILVEGIEDGAYLSTYLHLCERWQEFRRRGVHIVPTNSKSAMLEPLCVMQQLEIPLFVVFDCDDSPEQLKYCSLHERDNLGLLRALGVDNPVAFPQHPQWGDHFVQWPGCLSDVVQAEIGSSVWDECSQAACDEWGHAGNLHKNPLHIGSTLRLAWDKGARSQTLQKLCGIIVG